MSNSTKSSLILILFLLHNIFLLAKNNRAEHLSHTETGYIYLRYRAEAQIQHTINSSISSMSDDGKFSINPKALSFPFSLKVEEVYHDAQGFHVVCYGQTHDIEHGYVDSLIRNMSNKQLAYFQEKGCIQIFQSAHGELSLKAYVLLKGGGVGGAAAGVIIGKAGTHFICHGIIAAISWAVGLFCPPAGIATEYALESVLAAPIEALSIKVAIGAGIALGVATEASMIKLINISGRNQCGIGGKCT